ncbi:hypothetical protein [Plantactinospora soyae]|uniref:Uncharacterized protein n=1 Tax=Plantactinospora soyae TaxID=1544732 RepID=A0A927M3G4_9ACTN|nr:hypothetical protein [Plantactinospora soyae]MBE1487299.1 hypothetical protein [Plantactinospora soyae]
MTMIYMCKPRSGDTAHRHLDGAAIATTDINPAPGRGLTSGAVCFYGSSVE